MSAAALGTYAAAPLEMLAGAAVHGQSPRVKRPPSLSSDRTSGVLLHATSLPGPHGNGDLGAEARAFAEFLERAGQRWWQMLPVGPAGYGDSPYSALSAFAGSPLLVDLDALGIEVDSAGLPSPSGPVDYAEATRFRDKHLRRAFAARGSLSKEARRSFADFCERERPWLDDYALFIALKDAHGGVAWTSWEEGVRHRRKDALASAERKLASDVELAKFVQWHFAKQWASFREHCHARGIGLMGDLPIFVAHDSADVWQHRDLFKIDDDGTPSAVAGVPPDYFSSTGQRWGNPLYNWRSMHATDYAWWVDRFRIALARFDAVRLDHFIGFVRYWQIPASEPTAIHGKWLKGPGEELFHRVRAHLAKSLLDSDGSGAPLPFVAEDLGAVTPAVTRLRRALQLPGIKLVQFAFGTDPQAPTFLPYAHDRASVVYTGTHDNDTAVGWFWDEGGGTGSTRTAEEADRERRAFLAYAGRDVTSLGQSGFEVHWEMIRLAMMSVARTAMIPMQDVLGLGSDARMNRPGQPSGNWRWRLDPAAITPAVEARLAAMTATYGRGGVT